MNPSIKFIEGVAPLVEFYGDKLSFHDAEVLRIELKRGNPDLGEAFLEMDLHMFAVEGMAADEKHFIYGRHAVATLRFESIRDLELGGFNHQNAIMGLSIESIDPPENAMKLRVVMPEAFGVSANFLCYRCSLTGLKEGLPSGSVYA